MLTTIKVYAWYAVKNYKKKPNKPELTKFTQGGGGGCGHGTAFAADTFVVYWF